MLNWNQQECDQYLGGYSPGIKSGRILISKTQLDSLAAFLPVDEMFESIPLGPGNTMYRYKYAPTPYQGKAFDVEDLDPNDMHEHFTIIVNSFITALNELSNIVTVEGDEDEEFTYGAFCTALATCNRSEADWLLEHLFGNMYVMRFVEDEIDD